MSEELKRKDIEDRARAIHEARHKDCRFQFHQWDEDQAINALRKERKQSNDPVALRTALSSSQAALEKEKQVAAIYLAQAEDWSTDAAENFRRAEAAEARATKAGGEVSRLKEQSNAHRDAQIKAEAALSLAVKALEAVTPMFEKYMMVIPTKGDIQILQECVGALAAIKASGEGVKPCRNDHKRMEDNGEEFCPDCPPVPASGETRETGEGR